MIEFNGYITDEAEKFFWKKSKAFIHGLLLVIFLIILPVFIGIFIHEKNATLLIAFLITSFLIFLITLIPQGKKSRKKFTPKRIFTDGEYIVCSFDQGEEFKLIEDAVKLKDYGEFYTIIFPFGNMSDKFICQKSLLEKGTLEEFEALFEGKIERCIQNR